MQYVKLEDGQPAGDLLSRSVLRQQLPRNISFPLEIPADMLAEYGFAPVKQMQPPTVGLLDSARPEGYKLIDGTYHQAWVVDRVAFLDDAPAITVAAIEALAKSKRDAAVADYSPAEMAAWSMKRGGPGIQREPGCRRRAGLGHGDAGARYPTERAGRQGTGEGRCPVAVGGGHRWHFRQKRDAVPACESVQEV